MIKIQQGAVAVFFRLKPGLVAVLALLLGGVTAACSGQAGAAGKLGDGRFRLSEERSLMKTRFRIDVVVGDEAEGAAAIEAAYDEVARFEDVLSNWSDSSQITEINRAAGSAPVVVSDDLLTLLDRALHVSRLTDGAFDITFASCDGLWSVPDRRIPTDDEIAACLPHVNHRRVALDLQRSAVFLPDLRMRVGIAGLAKGYRVDRAARVLERFGVVDYVVDGGGDMRVSTGDGGRPWEISVAHPRRSGQALGTVSLTSGAIATSSDSQWYFEQDGVRYHHILDPATGRPARRSISATVIAPTALDADALATGFFVMGPDRGITLAEELPGVEALLVAPDLSVRTTSGFPSALPVGASS
jgi:thiamine biosynthesis lipoprotein